MRKIVIICGFLFLPISVFADTHYVSKTGSSIYPFTSWSTAADSIQKGINATSYGDTVRVGAGTYREYDITMTSGITLIGAGMDSCTIDGSRPSDENFTVIYGADSSTIEGFHVRGGNWDHAGGYGIWSDKYSHGALKRIRENKISYCWEGLLIMSENIEIVNNILEDNTYGISLYITHVTILNNTFFRNGTGVSIVGDRITIAKNLITDIRWSAISGYIFGDSLLIQNNLITDMTNIFDVSAIYLGEIPSFKARIINNTISVDHRYKGVRIWGIDAEIKNNIIANASYGVEADSYSCLVTASYNNLWNNTQNYLTSGGAVIDTSLGGNIYSDPMFVGGDDYRLQYGSPCIDAGDPNIKDPDSSRSDIGCYGGLYGETYTYLDLLPKAPDSLSAISESTVIILSWKPNTESDLSHYLVYKDTISWFVPDTTKIVGIIPKDSSVFRDYDFVLGKSYYYRVSAWDMTGHQSNYSDEIEVLATSVDEYTEEGPPLPRMYQLRQNYPNPFNPTTAIVYYLPDVGYQPAEVEIIIYNLLGQRVRTLVKEREYPGEHRVTWDGKDDAGSDLASGIYFYRLIFSGTDLSPLVKPKKMVLIR